MDGPSWRQTIDRRTLRVSVERYTTSDGVRWRVRWREAGGRKRSATAATKSEAMA